MCTTPFHVTDTLGHEVNVKQLHFGPSQKDCLAMTGDGHWYRVQWANDQAESTTTYLPSTLILRN